MAWRPAACLLRGVLDNRTPGKVVGWMKFAGVPVMTLIELEGDFGEDIRGRKVVLAGPGQPADPQAARQMRGFPVRQSGHVIRMTAGWDESGLAHFEWDSPQAGPVILPLQCYQVQVVGEPLVLAPPAVRRQQLMQFLEGLTRRMRLCASAAHPAVR